jgi:hypothetical protein
MTHHPDAVTINTRGGHKRGEAYLATWRFRRDDKFSQFWSHANEGAGIAREYFMHREAITKNEDLSDSARSRKLRELATEYIRKFGNEQHRLNQSLQALAKERQTLAAVKPYGGSDAAAQAILDAEIARMIREMQPAEREKLMPRLVDGEEARVVDAILRTPPILTGFSPHMRATIENAAIRREHPEAVMLQESLEESAQMAQDVLRQASSLVSESSGFSYTEVLGALGDNWRGLVKPIGSEEIADTLAKRHAPAPAA